MGASLQCKLLHTKSQEFVDVDSSPNRGKQNVLSTQLVKFYRGEGTDVMGRALATIWSFDDEELEDNHDYIQWLFPTDQRSAFNAMAPDFPPNVQKAFMSDEVIMKNLRISFDVYCEFLGFQYLEDRKCIVRTKDFPAKAKNWLSASVGPNHNWLRCSRVLHCLRLTGEIERRDAFYCALTQVYAEGLMKPCFASTVQYWQQAGGITGRPVPTQNQRTMSSKGTLLFKWSKGTQ